MSAVVTLAPRTSAAQTEAKMEIVVNRAALLAELTLAQGITSTKAVAPILMNILIEANDDSLTIIATNLDQSVKTSVPAKVKTPGIVTLPARKFFDYAKLLQAEEIKITALDNGWVQIRSGRSNTKMPGMDRANFPVMPEPGAAPRQDDADVGRASGHTQVTILRGSRCGSGERPWRRRSTCCGN
jgi:DNA polymerase III subunit beta